MRTVRLGRGGSEQDLHPDERRQRGSAARRTERSPSRSRLIPDGYQPPQGGFVFTGAINATLGDGESKTVEVEPGTHTVTESLDGRPFGISFRSSAPTATRPAISRRSRRRTRSTAGEHVTCVFTNQKRSIHHRQEGDQSVRARGSLLHRELRRGWVLALRRRAERLARNQGRQLLGFRDACSLGSRVRDLRQRRRAERIELPGDTIVTCTFVNAAAPDRVRSSSRRPPRLPATTPTSTSCSARRGSGSRTASKETFGDLAAGTYSVSEDTPEGWGLLPRPAPTREIPRRSSSRPAKRSHVPSRTRSAARSSSRSRRARTSPGSFTFTGDAAGSMATAVRLSSTASSPASTPRPRRELRAGSRPRSSVTTRSRPASRRR